MANVMDFQCSAPLGGCKNAGKRLSIYKMRTFKNRTQVEAKLGRKIERIQDLADYAVCPECAERLLKAAERQAVAQNLRFDPKSLLIWLDIVRQKLEAECAECQAEELQAAEDAKAVAKLGDLLSFQKVAAPVVALLVNKPVAEKKAAPKKVKKALAAKAG